MLKVFEYIYFSGLAYQDKADCVDFLQHDQKFKKLKKKDQQKIYQAFKAFNYPPKHQTDEDQLGVIMEQLDPIMQFERNSEGPLLRISLLLEVLKLYDLSVDEFIEIWLSNPENKPSSEKDILRFFGY